MKTVDGWVEVKIRDIIESSMPGEWGLDGNPEDGIPVLRSTNFRNNGTIDYSDIAYRKVKKEQLNKRLIERGTILIEKSGGSPSQPAGRVVYCDCDFNGTASNFIEVVKVKGDFSSQYIAYLLYYLYQIGLVLKYQQQTTGIINFKLNDYWEEKVNCPSSKPEQTKIAEVLSMVDQAIEQTEALIAKQQRIKTGLMQDLLTRGIDEHGNVRSEQTHKFKDSPLGRIPVEWEVQPLSSVVDLQVGYAFKSSWFSGYGIRLLRGENVGNGRPDWKDQKCLTDSIAIQFQDYELSAGDLIIGMDRTFTKQGFKVSLLGDEDVPSLLVQRVGRFRPLSIPDGFMRLLIMSPAYQRELLLQQKGMDIPHLSKSEILSPIVPIPKSTNEMTTIASRIQMFQRAEQDNAGHLQKLRSLKTALMQDLLTGRKRVTPLLKDEVITG
ncbi:MAG TPA: restriction endonuclease subunit S [Desulfitobacteriaceae bacterium]|nr:restriction endonuclease subunit S [Desulfitobacteriaceae bacterium]